MRDDLIGYLLGALEPAEHAAITARLAEDPQLRQDLERVQSHLHLLHDEPEEAPLGLATRCCQYVADRRGPCVGQFGARSEWRIFDLAMAAGLFVAASLIFLPALGRSREQSHSLACQQNLMTLGQALVNYSQIHDDYFPVVPRQGKFAVAGMYAPTLADGGWITSRDILCPASTQARQEEFAIPTLAQIERAVGDELRRLQFRMGGSYGYGLGYVDRGEYRGRRNRNRVTFALAADAPIEPSQPSRSHHGCSGQNVLFEDGHVRQLIVCHDESTLDHFFQNGMGFVAAGIDEDDAVIVPSGMPVMVLETRLNPAP